MDGYTELRRAADKERNKGTNRGNPGEVRSLARSLARSLPLSPPPRPPFLSLENKESEQLRSSLRSRGPERQKMKRAARRHVPGAHVALSPRLPEGTCDCDYGGKQSRMLCEHCE
jgi:hypothetical protein